MSQLLEVNTFKTQVMFRFFFFQAEDGIRDLTVTGVQTCALPISMPWEDQAGSWKRYRSKLDRPGASSPRQNQHHADQHDQAEHDQHRITYHTTPRLRSEERRVGKECRPRRSSHHQKKKP